MNLRAATPSPTSRPAVAVVVQQHAEEAAVLRHVRSVLVRAPHVGLDRLARLDERLAAHLDGLLVAGPAGRALCLAALERPGAGEVFALAVLAVEHRDRALLDRLLALWPALPDARRGLVSALGWVPAQALKGWVSELLAASPGPELELGLEACRLHRVDPGAVLAKALDSPIPSLQAVAARAAGELGRVDLLPALLARARAPAPAESEEAVLQAALAACLLGDRHDAMQTLAGVLHSQGPGIDRALPLVMAASTPAQAREWAQWTSQRAQSAEAGLDAQRRLLRVVAWLGDMRFVPWLIGRMADPLSTRLAGEAFHWITGADLALLDLETLDPPAGVQPVDDRDDDGSLGDDDSLPWPDVARVQAWWAREQAGLEATAAGGRLFLGRPANAQTAHHVLRSGTQRQRAHAAWLATLLQPGTPVFPVAAPVERQRRLLADLPA